MYLFIDGTQRQYIRNSIKITDELQERTNSATFYLDGSFNISYYEDVRIYEGAKIVSLSTTSLVIDRDYTQTNLFIAGSDIWLGLGLSTQEKVTIESVDGVNITLTANAINSHNANELMGIKKFAGSVIDIKDDNIRTLSNLQYFVTCVDYTRVFDKALINESYENRNARYIVNDFCNQFINYNQVIDQMDYADNAAIQAKWAEGFDGSNPTVDLSDYREGTSSGVFAWSFTGGSSIWTYSFVSPIDISYFTGVSSGTPIKGKIGFWYKANLFSSITTFIVNIGSTSLNKMYVTVDPTDNEWNFVSFNLKDASKLGTPDWTAVDYLKIELTSGSSNSIKFDGIRILEEDHFNHYPYVEDSTVFSNFRISRTKPISVMQRLANELSWFWYIDYDRNIRLFKEETNSAPFNLTTTSNNFSNLSLNWDTTKLTNRQLVSGADQTSVSTYSEVREGDGITREWITKSKFVNLVVSVDDNTSTDTAEAGTTTTNITATSHGLITGDYIVNRTRSNAVRKIVYVDDDNFTVKAVTSQTNGDTFSKFTAQVVGVEGINLDTGYNYMSNYNEKSIRSSETEDTLDSADFILFKYNEVVPILVEAKDDVSINNMIDVLGYSDGVFDGAPIVDKNIKTRTEAIALANVNLSKYSNVIIKATFTTSYEGLKSGQFIRITDTTNRNINQNFIIQKVLQKEIEDGENIFNITCSSSLFGIIEFFQQLLKQGRRLEVDEDAIVEKIITINENINVLSVASPIIDDEHLDDSFATADVATATTFTLPYKWGADADEGTWERFEWY